MSADFEFVDERIHLPMGAWARTERSLLRWRGRAVLGLTAGAWRPCLFPVYSPAGFLVTSESPADHPHHGSLWLAADHVHAWVPVAGGSHEIYAYNFYVNEVFQGRAPGRIVQETVSGQALDTQRFRITQTLRWQGPQEWGAPDGRVVLREHRVWTLEAGPRHHVLDVESSLTAQQWDVEIGPTRHAYFNVRVAEPMSVMSGGRLSGAGGLSGSSSLSGPAPHWVDASGPVGGGHWAGVALGRVRISSCPQEDMQVSCFASDFGVVTLNPFRHQGLRLRAGASLTCLARYVVHDGAADGSVLDALFAAAPESPCEPQARGQSGGGSDDDNDEGDGQR